MLWYCTKLRIDIVWDSECVCEDLGFYMNLFFRVLWLLAWRLRQIICVIGRVLSAIWACGKPLDVIYDKRMHWAEGHRFESYCCSLFFQVLLTQFRSLPPLFEDTPSAIHELSLASNVLGLYQLMFYDSVNDLWFICHWCCSCFNYLSILVIWALDH